MLETQSKTKWTYPSKDLPFLDAWEGRFEAAIIALHPFIKIPGLSPFENGRFTSSFSANSPPELEAEEDPIVARITKGGTLIQSYVPIEATTLTENPNYEIVTWDSIAAACGFLDKKEVYVALQTSIGTLRTEFEKTDAAKKLVRYAEKLGLYVPTEGHFQAVHLIELNKWLKTLGSNAVYLHYEYDDEPAESCKLPLPVDTRHRGMIRNDDNSAIATVEWDSFFTVIAGPKNAIAKLEIKLAPDVISVTASTNHHWWCQL